MNNISTLGIYIYMFVNILHCWTCTFQPLFTKTSKLINYKNSNKSFVHTANNLPKICNNTKEHFLSPWCIHTTFNTSKSTIVSALLFPFLAFSSLSHFTSITFLGSLLPESCVSHSTFHPNLNPYTSFQSKSVRSLDYFLYTFRGVVVSERDSK